MDASGLSPNEAAALEQIMQKKQVRMGADLQCRARSLTQCVCQMKDFMQLYSGLVERCFNDCITDFSSTK